VSFVIAPEQRKEWFIAALLPHIRLPLMQQKGVSQAEALEIAMKLEASPIGETSSGMSQIQNQLTTLTLELQSMKNGKEQRYEPRHEVWCTGCKGEGHDHEHCPLLCDYLNSGAPNSINQNQAPWCKICRTT
jgi:DnaJ-class molecular chaperone